jgi:hypothetical protein
MLTRLRGGFIAAAAPHYSRTGKSRIPGQKRA